eukprot:CAMPEP_0170467854 /NCGR_PEP_ID=MMETSP0123-20130129/11271_2 /TAXON_ID=182087 /ORGANISM="Favella ehrenbergii, Strain Fehren 1" /LENGTH=116 /DNA_ID=CAMNT_0010734313 /DNA_START=695 /DNA_END=1044 /DNA_ORIENTATION=-
MTRNISAGYFSVYNKSPIYLHDLTGFGVTKALIFVNIEEVAEFVDSESSAVEVVGDGTFFDSGDLIGEEFDFELQDLVAVANVEVTVAEVVYRVRRVLQLRDERLPIAPFAQLRRL